MKTLESLPDECILEIIAFLARDPREFLPILEVCRSWRDRFGNDNFNLWFLIGKLYHIDLSSFGNAGRIRSHKTRLQTNLRRTFILSFHKRQIQIQEKHEYCILQAKVILDSKRDCPSKLKKLISKIFPISEDFNPNYQSETLEKNSILTLAARYCHIRCMKLIHEQYNTSSIKADIDKADVGGFTALIICAYLGYFVGVQYCVEHGADVNKIGRLRSGAPLTAEHWAAVQGHYEIFSYLRAHRLRTEKRRLDSQILNRSNYDSIRATNALEHQTPSTNLQQRSSIQSLEPFEHVDYSHGSFCICGRGFVGDMIACDNNECFIEWFHAECVGIADITQVQLLTLS